MFTTSAGALLEALTVVTAGAGGWALRAFRYRGAGTAPAGAGVFAALHAISVASGWLRGGLTERSARKAARQLRLLIGASAVAVTDTERLLAWDGAGRGHADAALWSAYPVLTSRRPRVLTREMGVCGDPRCPIKIAMIAPLIIEGRVAGTVTAYGESTCPQRLRILGEVARWLSGQLELAELDTSRSRLMEAEMRARRAQISPHFVYNSLTTIASFVRTDPERARELLLDFADFARYAFRDPRDVTTLAEELRSIDRYLLLERARFGDDRLRFSVEIAPEVLPVAVPFLSLQPLVENAIRHGMECGADGFHVRITARDAGAEAVISVEDDGVGMDPDELRALLAAGDDGRPAQGIGLVNVDDRLRRVYGDDYGLVIETAVGAGMKVSFRIPKCQTQLSVR